MKKGYFEDCRTLEQLKEAYYGLVRKYHPDSVQDESKKLHYTEILAQINDQYDEIFPLLKDKHETKDGKEYTKETNEKVDEFRDILEKILHFEGTIIEIIGSFVWISGDTKPYKDTYKELGFRWHSTKKAWYLAPTDYKKSSKKKYSMDEIREMYGTEDVKVQGRKKLG